MPPKVVDEDVIVSSLRIFNISYVYIINHVGLIFHCMMMQITGSTDPTSPEVPLPLTELLRNLTNVDSDGHCGFRAIALTVLGDQNLW